MPVYYPAFLSIEGRPCLVVGGGQIAERKVKGLLEAGGKVTLVSPTVTPRLRRRIDKGQVEYFNREFQSSDMDGIYLLITATDDMPLNRRIGIEGRNLGLVVNVVDDPRLLRLHRPLNRPPRRHHLRYLYSRGQSRIGPLAPAPNRGAVPTLIRRSCQGHGQGPSSGQGWRPHRQCN